MVFDQKSLTIFGVYLGYRFLKGCIAGWRDGPVGSDSGGSQKPQPIEGEILPPLRGHISRRIEQDIF
jgi:hypothetical protein